MGHKFRKSDMATFMMIATMLGSLWKFISMTSGYQHSIEEHGKWIAKTDPIIDSIKETQAAIIQHLEDLSKDTAIIKQQTK